MKKFIHQFIYFYIGIYSTSFFSLFSVQPLPFELLQSFKISFNLSSSLINESSFKELQLDYFVEVLLDPPSPLCKEGLLKTIIPLNTSTDIEERQRIIQALVENEDLYNQLNYFCKKLDLIYASALFSYWNPDHSLHQRIESFYFDILPSWFNDHPSLLQLGVMSSLGGSFKNIIKSLSLQGIFGELSYALFNKKTPRLKQALLHGWKEPFILHLPIAHNTPNQTDGSSYNLYSAYDWYTYFIENHHYPKVCSLMATLAYITFMDYILANEIYISFQETKRVTHNLSELKKHLALLSQFFEDLQKTALLLHTSGCAFSEDFKPLFTLIEYENSTPALQKIVPLLHALSTQKVPFTQYGKMLFIHKLFHENKNELLPLIHALATLEAYMHIAYIFKTQHPSTPYCFTQFKKNTRPFIELTNFWLPLLPAHQAVTNSCALGPNTSQHIIFNGPHWCGKSIAMKSIAYSIIFSQAWGIAPASQATMSFFTGMRTAINITDNVKEGESGFSAEKNRLERINTFIHTARPSDCYFLLLVEPLTKTNPEIIGSLLYDFGLELGIQSQCITVMSSNHPRILDLTKTGLWGGYYVDLLEPETGNFIRTYKIHPGISTWWTSLKPEDIEKRSRFINWIGTKKS